MHAKSIARSAVVLAAFTVGVAFASETPVARIRRRPGRPGAGQRHDVGRCRNVGSLRFPAHETRVRAAAAAQGPEALRRYIHRTRMIYNLLLLGLRAEAGNAGVPGVPQAGPGRRETAAPPERFLHAAFLAEPHHHWADCVRNPVFKLLATAFIFAIESGATPVAGVWVLCRIGTCSPPLERMSSVCSSRGRAAMNANRSFRFHVHRAWRHHACVTPRPSFAAFAARCHSRCNHAERFTLVVAQAIYRRRARDPSLPMLFPAYQAGVRAAAARKSRSAAWRCTWRTRMILRLSLRGFFARRNNADPFLPQAGPGRRSREARQRRSVSRVIAAIGRRTTPAIAGTHSRV